MKRDSIERRFFKGKGRWEAMAVLAGGVWMVLGYPAPAGAQAYEALPQLKASELARAALQGKGLVVTELAFNQL